MFPVGRRVCSPLCVPTQLCRSPSPTAAPVRPHSCGAHRRGRGHRRRPLIVCDVTRLLSARPHRRKQENTTPTAHRPPRRRRRRRRRRSRSVDLAERPVKALPCPSARREESSEPNGAKRMEESETRGGSFEPAPSREPPVAPRCVLSNNASCARPIWRHLFVICLHSAHSPYRSGELRPLPRMERNHSLVVLRQRRLVAERGITF